MLMCPWICYLISEGIGLSGIVSILTNGLVLSYYATPNVLKSSRKGMQLAVDTVAHVSETMVFLFLGVGGIAFDNLYDEMGVWTMVLALLNINMARFISTFLVSCIVNKYRSEHCKISNK